MTLSLGNILFVQSKIKTPMAVRRLPFVFGLMAQSNLGLECIATFVTEENLTLP